MATLTEVPLKKTAKKENRSKEYLAAEKAVLAKNADLLAFLDRFGHQLHKIEKKN
ncbi:hypothetical protein [Dyadobacter luticola]|uniref:hypothetical protein n=1 Tax=Dyadobacter luticola TaxID=1979387 RepID=UPI0014873035|nr:hypothetical protein [Dyadobacter luticola]